MKPECDYCGSEEKVFLLSGYSFEYCPKCDKAKIEAMRPILKLLAEAKEVGGLFVSRYGGETGKDWVSFWIRS
jgi:hypothetical protein